MLWIEFTRFKCPECGSAVDVAAQGQNLIERMERPSPFECPVCKTELILNPRKFLFRLGFALLIMGGPFLHFWLEQGTVSFVALIVGALVLIFSLLSNRLITKRAQ